jgi:hypothetical protein
MTLSGHVITGHDGMKGFDCNTVLSPFVAKKFFDAGYRFVVRYVGRTVMANFDLGTKEAEGILAAGLGLMVVQHVAVEGWKPTGTLGLEYGVNAARFCKQLGLPSGVSVWCDLEGVNTHTQSQDAIDFCNQWHSEVACQSYLPGLYVGWRPGMTAHEIYSKLRFTHYWGAYNVDAIPLPRGFQMRQYAKKDTDKVGGVTFDFDVNYIRADSLGGRPSLLRVAP